ncbi:MAG: structural protein P5 [Rikenellaceae bacterium]|nr:structural protein P5 [Rikenellaceae bacterium]
MSRGIDNCNPGNIRLSRIRYRGEVRPSRDPEFRQFESLAWGYRAIFVLLDTYRRRYGLDTLRGMIGRWAPPSENRTEHYIAIVSERTGIEADERIDTRDRATMVAIAAAISWVENGATATMREVFEGWRLYEELPA